MLSFLKILKAAKTESAAGKSLFVYNVFLSCQFVANCILIAGGNIHSPLILYSIRAIRVISGQPSIHSLTSTIHSTPHPSTSFSK